MPEVTGATQISDFSFAGAGLRQGLRRPRAVLLAAALIAWWWVAASPAEARPYTVYACDAAGFWGYANNAWTPLGAGTIESRCPSNNDSQRGLTTRIVGGDSYPGLTASIFDFFAPPGTTITGIRWSGRLARNNCAWSASIVAYPAASIVVGVPNEAYCSTEEFDLFSSILSFPAPAGTTHLRQMVICGRTNCDPGATFHSRHIEVNLEDWWAPSVSASGALADGHWVSGEQVVRVDTADNTGIRRMDASIPGTPARSAEFSCNPTFAVPCPGSPSADLSLETTGLNDGTHTLAVTATDGAGNATTANRTVRVDNTPPDPVAPSLMGGEGWRTTNDFGMSWVNSTGQHAPITAAGWELCSEGRCVEGSRQESGIEEIRNLAVPRPGDHTARIWLEDAAGNSRREAAIAAVHMRFDPVAPGLTFESPDPADPLRVGVLASDQHSGVADGDIEIRRAGTNAWHGLDTRLEDGRLVAYVDDERFRRGTYEFRAHVVDHAGNEASIGPQDAGAAGLRLPVRAVTRLKAGLRRVGITRRVVRRHGRRRMIRRRVISFDPRFRARYRRPVKLHGRLTNGEGQALADATIDVLDESSTGRSRLVATLQADRNGSFSYRFRARRNRLIRFRYHGSRRIGPADAPVRVLVPATTSIDVSRSTVLNGESVRFRGRVKTGPLPPAGKLVEVQAHFRDRWRTFSTVRTDRNGRWRFPYRFGGTVGRVRYRFRVVLPAEGGYPFTTGASRMLRVLVVGL